MSGTIEKKLELSIDQASWTNIDPKYQHPIPQVFSNSPTEVAFDYLNALNWAGAAAVSPSMVGWSNAVKWAEVRYLYAVDHTDTWLRLVPGMGDLDPHYLGSLSDDLGLGIGIEWVSKTLGLQNVAHGRRWCDLLVEDHKAIYRREPGKRGPSKCPDLVGYDAQGKIYLIECKGTTSNPRYTETQFEQSGLDQKISVIFANEGRVGQRLVTGVFIARHDSKEASRLTIVDPPPNDGSSRRPAEPVLTISEEAEPSLLIRAIKRDIIERSLLMSGFAFESRKVLNAKDDVLDRISVKETTTFKAEGRVWNGIVQELQLPEELLVAGHRYRQLVLRSGVSPELLSVVRGDSLDPKSAFDDYDLKLHRQEAVGPGLPVMASLRSGDVAFTGFELR